MNKQIRRYLNQGSVVVVTNVGRGGSQEAKRRRGEEAIGFVWRVEGGGPREEGREESTVRE